MPALANPRWEMFAQAILAGMSQDSQIKNTAKAAYLAAGYSANNGNSAEVCGHRLLRKVKPIADRIRELQDEQNKRLAKKIDISRERFIRRLDKASEIAEQDRNTSAMGANEVHLAKFVGLYKDSLAIETSTDFSNVTSMQDIGRKLLQQVGLREPDDVSIQEAIAANDALIAALEAIRDRAQGLTVEHDAR